MNLFIFLSQMGSNHHFRNFDNIDTWEENPHNWDLSLSHIAKIKRWKMH